MIKRKHGVFACVSSSGAARFMGPYEVFKTAQVELANTLTSELEGTGVHAFTIGPGIVRTPGFEEGGGKVASLMGISLDDLLEMNRSLALPSEAAGTGFAAAIALASRYDGQETSSIQVLRDIGIVLGDKTNTSWQAAGDGGSAAHPVTETEKAVSEAEGLGTLGGAKAVEAPAPSLEGLVARVAETYEEQSEGWKKRNLFERQWVARDFKKQTGMSIEEMRGALRSLQQAVPAAARVPSEGTVALARLAAYYRHQQKLLEGFEKNPERLKANLATLQGWIVEVDAVVHRTGGDLGESERYEQQPTRAVTSASWPCR